MPLSHPHPSATAKDALETLPSCSAPLTSAQPGRLTYRCTSTHVTAMTLMSYLDIFYNSAQILTVLEKLAI